jgi:hypothetical protein
MIRNRPIVRTRTNNTHTKKQQQQSVFVKAKETVSASSTTMKIMVSPFIALLMLSPTVAASAAWPDSRSVLATIRQQTASAAAAASRGGGGRGRALFSTYNNNNNNKMELFPIQRARALQATGGGDDMCAPTDIYEFDDDNLRTFNTSFAPVCTCNIGDSFNIEQYFDENPVPTDASLLDQWIKDLNDFGRSLVFDEQVGCRNECSVCTSENSPCLILEQSEAFMFRGSVNFTLDDILTIGSDLLDEDLLVFLEESTSMTCYRAEGSSSGKVCITETNVFSSDVGIASSEIGEEAVIYGCALSVDGVDCTSCSVDETTNCVMADCTNIAGDSSAMIDSCNADRASFPGVFGPLYDIQAEGVTYSLGRCDDDGSSSTPPPPPPPPNAAPVATPVAMSGPTTAPAAVSAPVTGPASSPESAPVSSPASLPGSAPASAPEPTPVSSTVTSPNSAPVLSPQPPIVAAAADSGATEYNAGGGRSVLTLLLVSAVAAIMIP